ncbi:hypothetical protein [Sphingomonas bacterium]|uniref:hypothetical protein n=1 Tax=Sphingomonas bacterium TaxID=1895847 RepID=UPI001575BCEE|nr:hypothetical protein [Sphingomonas bacterium]
MQAFRIDLDGVTEVDLADDFLVASGVMWDYFELDAKHVVYVDDMGMFAERVDLASVGPNRATPLPAYVLGVDGEDTVGATMSFADVRALVPNVRPGAKLSFSVSNG